MKNNTSRSSKQSPLLGNIDELFAAHHYIFQQHRTFERMCKLARGMFLTLGRHTVTQAIRAIGEEEKDWTAWYDLFNGERFHAEKLFRELIHQTIASAPADQPYVTAVDCTQIARSSDTMPGSGWMPAPGTAVWRKGLHRAQRMLTCAWLPPMQEGYTRAIPIRCLSAYTPKSEPAEDPPRKDWEAAMMHIHLLREQLNQEGRREQKLIVLADGAFDKATVWQGLPDQTFLIVRTAKNRVLYNLPEAMAASPQKRSAKKNKQESAQPKKIARGRPRKYGEKAPAPSEQLAERGGWRSTQITLRGRQIDISYKLRGCYLRETAPNCPLFLIIIDSDKWTVGKRRPRTRYRDPAYFLVRAALKDGVWILPCPIEQILIWLWQRWEIEVIHREMKTSFGVGDIQCWGKASSTLSVQWMVWLFGLVMLGAYRAWGLFDGPAAYARWWSGARRWSFNTLWSALRAELWTRRDFHPGSPLFPATRPKIIPVTDELARAAASVMRG